MLDRLEGVLKIVCLGLAALLMVRVVNHIAHSDPLGSASVPPLPKLTAASEKTNNVTAKTPAKDKTAETNKVSGAKDTNSVTAVKPKRPRRGGMPGMFGMGGPALNLPAAVQARLDRIKESEILGPFMRPLPMALLGIADNDVFLRAPNGQSGMIKEGEELGGVKLVRIGINRVLVEEDGEKKELTLFDGIGGDSLMPKDHDERSTNSTATATNAPVAPDHKEHPK